MSEQEVTFATLPIWLKALHERGYRILKDSFNIRCCKKSWHIKIEIYGDYTKNLSSFYGFGIDKDFETAFKKALAGAVVSRMKL